MYLDISLKKILLLCAVGVILYAAVNATFFLKDARYGSTPPFASAALAVEEISLRSLYGFLGVVWDIERRVQSVFGPGTGEVERTARAVPVLTYHRIVNSKNDLNNVTANNFHDQMLTLKEAGWQTITLAEYRAYMRGDITLPEKSFLITFDDGAKESFYPVDPILSALGYSAVMYVIAHAAEIPESTYYLSSTEIRRMLETGRWEIGSHSYDGHRPYSTDSAEGEGLFFADKLWRAEDGRLETVEEFRARVHEDLVHARSDLESTYGGVIETFAFPLGNETGIAGSANFPEGASITEHEAGEIYALGFLQTSNNVFSFNYPSHRAFIAYRIHVDYDWSGARLLRQLEVGLPKDVPYQDSFAENRGWIAAWGMLDVGTHNLALHSDSDASSASIFLDGTYLWDSYTFDASAHWQSGSISLLVDLIDAKTYDTCAFSPGSVRIQHTESGTTTVAAEKRNALITFGPDVHIGARVHGDVIECTWNYTSVIEVYDRSHGGGVGVQVWNPMLGSASAQLSEVLVRPF